MQVLTRMVDCVRLDADYQHQGLPPSDGRGRAAALWQNSLKGRVWGVLPPSQKEMKNQLYQRELCPPAKSKPFRFFSKSLPYAQQHVYDYVSALVVCDVLFLVARS